MENGNILQFLEKDDAADRLQLVLSLLKYLSSFMIDDPVIIQGERCHKGTYLYARPGSSPWRSQAGMDLNPHSSAAPAHNALEEYFRRQQWPRSTG